MAKIIVGAAAEEFHVHSALLCESSMFFKGALDGSFKKTESQEVTLKDADTDTFQLVVHWLYHGLLERLADDGTFTIIRQRESAKVWVFGDKYGMRDLRNCAITAYHQNNSRYRTHIPVETFVYEHCLVDSTMRKVVVHGDLLLKNDIDSKSWSREGLATLPQEFLMDLIIVMGMYKNRRKMSQKEWGKIDVCRFHEHAEGTSCQDEEV